MKTVLSSTESTDQVHHLTGPGPQDPAVAVGGVDVALAGGVVGPGLELDALLVEHDLARERRGEPAACDRRAGSQDDPGQ